MSSAPLPRVVVLLATWNGMPWLPDQVESILGQRGVEVEVRVRDDGSTDGTREWLAAHPDPRLVLEPDHSPSGSAAGNFYRLLLALPHDDERWTALADQDDVWLPDKLRAAIDSLAARGADGYSSDALAVYPNGKEHRLGKASPQRRFDYLLESAGPGCTFVLTPRARHVVVDTLRARVEAAEVDSHDWLVYALVRAAGLTWTIDSVPRIRYRQHGRNAVGANAGVRAARKRFALIRSRWHRDQAARVTLLAADVARREGAPSDDLERWARAFTESDAKARWRIVRGAAHLRRRARDRMIVAILAGLGVW